MGNHSVACYTIKTLCFSSISHALNKKTLTQDILKWLEMHSYVELSSCLVLYSRPCVCEKQHSFPISSLTLLVVFHEGRQFTEAPFAPFVSFCLNVLLFFSGKILTALFERTLKKGQFHKRLYRQLYLGAMWSTTHISWWDAAASSVGTGWTLHLQSEFSVGS